MMSKLKEWYIMNKKGQTLVVFIIFVPVLIAVMALVVDKGIMYNAKNKGEKLLEEAKNKDLDIKDYFEINDIVIDLENTSKNDKECVIIKYSVESIFGKIIGFEKYDIVVSDC